MGDFNNIRLYTGLNGTGLATRSGSDGRVMVGVAASSAAVAEGFVWVGEVTCLTPGVVILDVSELTLTPDTGTASMDNAGVDFEGAEKTGVSHSGEFLFKADANNADGIGVYEILDGPFPITLFKHGLSAGDVVCGKLSNTPLTEISIAFGAADDKVTICLVLTEA